MAYVIDPSVALAWLLPDESNARANTIRQAVEDGVEAWIPTHWWLEIGNGLLMAERRGRIAAEQVAQALTLVDALPFKEDEHTAEQVAVRTFPLARKHGLTLYDAAYLELAQRRGATLATFDGQLIKAAKMEQVPTDNGGK
ncbi:MAG: type II toxin-antitoxin system VapC family toxin [Verrucomicrobiota bacterium]|jgi:predicted nucleic acid-binding protein